MTRADHPTGTDRVAEVAARIDEARIIVNVQGDEPEIAGETIDRLVALLENDPEAPMATLATPIRDEAVYRDPSCVKVVCSRAGRALYFSRSPIPCHRDGLPDPRGEAPLAHLHLGLYAYRRDFLLSVGSLPRSPLEAAEKLEQLRVLEAGLPDRHRHRRRAERSASTPRRTTAGSWSGGTAAGSMLRPPSVRLRDAISCICLGPIWSRHTRKGVQSVRERSRWSVPGLLGNRPVAVRHAKQTLQDLGSSSRARAS